MRPSFAAGAVVIFFGVLSAADARAVDYFGPEEEAPSGVSGANPGTSG